MFHFMSCFIQPTIVWSTLQPILMVMEGKNFPHLFGVTLGSPGCHNSFRQYRDNQRGYFSGTDGVNIIALCESGLVKRERGFSDSASL